jgi:hypothetical protein
LFMERAENPDARVIHQDVNRPELALRLANQSDNLFSVSHIGLQGKDFDAFAAQAGCRLFKMCGVSGADGHAGAHLSELARDRQPDPPAGSGNQSNLSCDQLLAIHRVPPAAPDTIPYHTLLEHMLPFSLKTHLITSRRTACVAHEELTGGL